VLYTAQQRTRDGVINLINLMAGKTHHRGVQQNDTPKTTRQRWRPPPQVTPQPNAVNQESNCELLLCLTIQDSDRVRHVERRGNDSFTLAALRVPITTVAGKTYVMSCLSSEVNRRLFPTTVSLITKMSKSDSKYQNQDIHWIKIKRSHMALVSGSQCRAGKDNRWSQYRQPWGQASQVVYYGAMLLYSISMSRWWVRPN